MRAKGGYIYILSNKRRNVLYIGVTSNLFSRVYEHRHGIGSKFTSKYKCIDLVYYDSFPTIDEAITKEKQLKKWKRAWKDKLIHSFNPTLRDLYDEVKEMQ